MQMRVPTVQFLYLIRLTRAPLGLVIVILSRFFLPGDVVMSLFKLRVVTNLQERSILECMKSRLEIFLFDEYKYRTLYKEAAYLT